MPAELAYHVISAGKLPDLQELLASENGASAPWKGTPARVYYGSEFCVHLLPSPAELRTGLDFAGQAGLPLTLVTPYGGDRFVDKVAALLDILPEKTEVVANDWGALRRISKDGRHIPIMGRMLSKVMRDPWVQQEWDRAGDLPKTTLRLPELLMESLGIQRAETDALPGGAFPPIDGGGFDLSVYLPWTPLGSGRVCFAGSFGLGPSPRFGVIDDCARHCRNVHMKLDDPSVAECGEVEDTYLAGNTMLFRHPPDVVRKAMDTLPETVTRVVWEPWIPA